MVSVLRVLARTRSFYGASDQLDSRCPYRRGDRMKRRDFIALLGGAAAWPLVARAQQPEQMRRIGVATGTAADDPDGQARLRGFLQGLKQSGWTEGRNVRIDARWGAGDADLRRYAAELIALAPDVIMASGNSTVGPLLQATRTVPIVFALVADPVGSGFVDSLARPDGNVTGLSDVATTLSTKR